MELLKSLFENVELPAEFKEKTATLFEAAVDEKVKADLAILQEAFDAKLATSTETLVAESVAAIDAVVESTILEWAKENAVPLDSQIKAQIAESFLSGLKGIFEKADIELSGDTAGVAIQELREQNATLVKESTDAKVALVEANDKLVAIKVKEIIEEMTKGLADTQLHRVTKLCEAFDFKGEDDFKAKVALVVEAVGGIKGTFSADGSIVAVTGDKKTGAVVDTAAGAAGAEDGELVTKPSGTKNVSAEGDKGIPVVKPLDPLREQYDKTQIDYAPHLHSDMVAETMKLFK